MKTNPITKQFNWNKALIKSQQSLMQDMIDIEVEKANLDLLKTIESDVEKKVVKDGVTFLKRNSDGLFLDWNNIAGYNLAIKDILQLLRDKLKKV